MGSKTRQQLEEWVNILEIETDNVIDIGGSQFPIPSRVAKWNVTNYKILDLEHPHECKQKPDIIMDINKSDSVLHEDHAYYSSNKFDVAFCLEVTEYWHDPMRALNNIAYLLKQGGKLYISFHFIYPVHNPPQYDYMRYTRAGAEKLLKEAGFEILSNRPRLGANDSMGFLYQFYSSDRMRPTKLENCHNEIGCLIEAKKL